MVTSPVLVSVVTVRILFLKNWLAFQRVGIFLGLSLRHRIFCGSHLSLYRTGSKLLVSMNLSVRAPDCKTAMDSDFFGSPPADRPVSEAKPPNCDAKEP